MKIILACSGGMSTSLLVQKIEKAGKEKDPELMVKSCAISSLDDIASQYDIILVAPQVRHRLSTAQESGKKYNIPVALVDQMAYGTLDGEKVYQQAKKEIEKNKK